MTEEQITELIHRYLNGECNQDECHQVEEWYGDFETLPIRPFGGDQEALRKMKEESFEELGRKIALKRLREQEEAALPKRRLIRRWLPAAAAALVLALTVPLWPVKKKPVVKPEIASRYTDDVPPGGNRAVLTLAGGQQVVLDNAAKGLLTNQGNVKVIKVNNGLVAYHLSGRVLPSLTPVQYNTLTTPRGGQYRLRLPDGTEVWLNAASSIRFPTAFTGDRREVEITGEAYFEVAQDARMPFIVKKGATEVDVLGTHFNFNAYDDEKDIKVTLLEGSVRVVQAAPGRPGRMAARNAALLIPGQQARVGSDGLVRLIRNADVDQAVAWKNGEFSFQHSDIYEVMRQIARWYDVDVSYQDSLDVRLSGDISKNVNASAVFRMLEFAGNVHFKMAGRKIIVMK